MTCRLALTVAVGLLCAPSVGLADSPDARPEKPDAVLATSDDLRDHEGHGEGIHDHEGRTEDLQDHRGRSSDLSRHHAGSGDIDDRRADAEDIDGRIAESERLRGTRVQPPTPQERLAAAREKLRAAREQHAHHERRAREQAAPAAPAADPELPAASQRAQDPWAHWTARIDVARQRIDVAEAALAVWDESYAKMIQADYPRGDARQKLVDSRERARERVEAEKARLPRVIEEARRAGVPPGILQQHLPAAQ